MNIVNNCSKHKYSNNLKMLHSTSFITSNDWRFSPEMKSKKKDASIRMSTMFEKHDEQE